MKICQNTGKTQGILIAQVIHSLILKIKDISLFAANFFFLSWTCQFGVCNSNKSLNWHRGNLQSDREKTGNLKIKFEWVPCFFFILIFIY